MMVEIVEATSPALIGQTRDLLVRYGVENGLTPENSKRFYEDLGSLPGRYAQPHGRLWVALEGGSVVGYVGVCRVGDSACEVKQCPQRRSRS